jgi:hypothetical protein
MQQLGLDAQQQAAATAALGNAEARIRAAAQSPSAGNPLGGGGLPGMRRVFGDPRDPAAANRQRLVNAIATVLTPEQLQKYLAMDGRNTEHAATLYVPGADGNPQARQVRVGLADDNYVELVSGLAAGDKVIVRAPAAKG